MESLKIVCVRCNHINHVKNEVIRENVVCEACSHSLLDTVPVECDVQGFNQHIFENDIPVLVDFYSPECAPCMKMAPDYEKAAASFGLEVRFIKINTQNDPDLARQYGVNMLPTIVAFKNAKEVNRFSSALSKDQLSMWAESLIQMTL
ncbi:MAG: thioredoxin domain-containing protein [Sulfuricurvum sp.]|uniref:thioredoxin family protein n=1 Tax=Sulfuricurvum sp. TaxID=2025608 RepID=UPI0035620E3E